MKLQRSVKARVVMCLLTAVLAAPIVRSDELSECIQKGVGWLITQQDRKSGAYAVTQTQPAATALMEIAILESNLGYFGPFVTQGYDYILQHKQSKGGIFAAGQNRYTYNTSLALIALITRNDEKDAGVIANAKNYLLNMQFTEDDGPITPEFWMYGGWGYDDLSLAPKPDIVITDWALEAFKRAELPKEDAAWQRAVTFLEHCQNLKSLNDWASDDGGFIFSPMKPFMSKSDRESRRGKSAIRSYGSATCAGLKGYLYAGLPKGDPRVQGAYGWLKKYYTLKENPAKGDHDLYYYYYSLAKSLSAYGEKHLPDESGKMRDWAKDLSAYLIKHQQADGSWHNVRAEADEKVLRPEQSAELVTAYALRALSICAECLKK